MAKHNCKQIGAAATMFKLRIHFTCSLDPAKTLALFNGFATMRLTNPIVEQQNIWLHQIDRIVCDHEQAVVPIAWMGNCNKKLKGKSKWKVPEKYQLKNDALLKTSNEVSNSVPVSQPATVPANLYDHKLEQSTTTNSKTMFKPVPSILSKQKTANFVNKKSVNIGFPLPVHKTVDESKTDRSKTKFRTLPPVIPVKQSSPFKIVPDHDTFANIHLKPQQVKSPGKLVNLWDSNMSQYFSQEKLQFFGLNQNRITNWDRVLKFSLDVPSNVDERFDSLKPITIIKSSVEK